MLLLLKLEGQLQYTIGLRNIGTRKFMRTKDEGVRKSYNRIRTKVGQLIGRS